MEASVERGKGVRSRCFMVIGVLSGLLAATGGCAPKPHQEEQSASAVERGKYLVTILACNDCHTPFKMGPSGPEPDMTRMLSGHPESAGRLSPPHLEEGPWLWTGAATNTAYAGPWGISYAMNLTPDEVSGLGIWTEDMFIRALRTGRHMGQSRPLLPPMPWPSLARMTDADLKAIYAYLRSIPAIRNQAPDAAPATP